MRGLLLVLAGVLLAFPGGVLAGGGAHPAGGESFTRVPPVLPAGTVIGATLSPVATCNGMPRGSGMVQIVEQHVTGVNRSLVTVVITLRGAWPNHIFKIRGAFVEGANRYRRSAGLLETDPAGYAHVGARFAPALSPGASSFTLNLADYTCGPALHHPAAYVSQTVTVPLG